MQHFVEIYTSEGFAWGVLFGAFVGLALDWLDNYAKKHPPSEEK